MTYQVLGKWPETLWKKYKITGTVYEDLLFKTRDGVPGRKRNLDACREHEERKAVKDAMQARINRMKGNPELFKPFPKIAEVFSWLLLFTVDALRYPILILMGASHVGKTEFAKSLFERPLELKIGALDFFPDKLRQFKRGHHDGVVLDDVRDLNFLVLHQDKLQGKWDTELEFGSTAGGTCAFLVDWFCMPLVVTVNYSTKNMHLLHTDDWLSKPANRCVVNYQGFEGAAA
jgi:hypothetical protein